MNGALLDALQAPYFVARPFLRRRLPKDDEVERVLLLGSATDKVVREVIEVALARYPNARLSAYVDRTREDEYRLTWPEVGFRPIDSSENVARPGALVNELRSNAFDIAVIIWSGERGFWRRKAVGMVAGARFIAIYNENADSFYWNVWDSGLIAGHFWHRTGLRLGAAAARGATRGRGRLARGRGRLAFVSLLPAYGLEFGRGLVRSLRPLLIPAGYVLILARVTPLLVNGLIRRGEKPAKKGA